LQNRAVLRPASSCCYAASISITITTEAGDNQARI